MYNLTMTKVTASEARASLPALLDRVTAGEEVTITRHGKPVAVVVRPDALTIRRADEALQMAADVRDLLSAGRGSSLSSVASLEPDRAEELISEVRAARDAR